MSRIFFRKTVYLVVNCAMLVYPVNWFSFSLALHSLSGVLWIANILKLVIKQDSERMWINCLHFNFCSIWLNRNWLLFLPRSVMAKSIKWGWAFELLFWFTLGKKSLNYKLVYIFAKASERYSYSCKYWN